MVGPTVTGAYAIQALVCLARRGDWVRGSETLATETRIPRSYLVKILHALAREGLVVTRRGRRGGYRLARSPERITLFDVVAAVEGPEVFSRCLLGLGRCSPERGCPVHAEWSSRRRLLLRRFRELTLRELATFDRWDFERDYRSCLEKHLKSVPECGGSRTARGTT